MFGLNVTYIMKPGSRKAFLAAVEACGVREDILKEDGCIQYEFFLPERDGDRLLLMEKWTSREAQQIHLTQPHMAKLRAAKGELVLDTLVEVYDLP